MIHNKYTTKELLERMKLMMEYDASKTYTENKEKLTEQDTGTKTAISTGTAAAVGAGYGAAAGAGALGGLGTSVAGGSLAVGSTLAPGLGAAGAAALGAGVIGGAAALALTPLVIWYMDKDNAQPKVQKIMNYCTTDRDKINKIERGLPDTTIRDLSDKLYDAMEGWGTNEESVYDAFRALKTASDFCALVDRFNRDYGSQGDLMEWLDDDFDASSEWEEIYRPIRNVVEDTLLNIKDETIEDKCKTNPNDPACKKDDNKKDDNKDKQKKVSQYKSCPDTFPIAQFCKNGTIRKVQGCLGITADGAFGPKTQKALEAKGLPGTSITQDSVDKACGGTENKLTSDVEDQEMLTSTDNTSTTGTQSVSTPSSKPDEGIS